MYTKFIILSVLFVGLAEASPNVDPLLRHKLKNQPTINLLLTISPSNKNGEREAIFSKFQSQSYPTRGEKLTALAQSLKNLAAKEQNDILRFIDEEKSERTQVQPFWITNKIILRQADSQLVEKLWMRDDIAVIEEEKIFSVEKPTIAPAPAPKAEGAQWGVSIIRAPHVWAAGNKGEGAVVATLDTGVLSTHESLVGNYRADYGWYDPEGATATPNDELGFGTHSMGIIAGQTQGIGVAPGAQWIACKGCGFGCSEMALLACGQWLLCPTDVDGNNEDCTKAPHVINHAWRGPPGESFYDEILEAHKVAGIVSISSVGKAGPGCVSVDYPGESPLVLGIGGTNDNDSFYEASSVGPTWLGRIKPDLSAPGYHVYSALGDADDSYALIDGTSRSSAHVAGLVALMVSHNSSLSVDEIQEALQGGAVHIIPSGGTCGGINDNVYPNNYVGYGRVDAVNSVFDL